VIQHNILWHRSGNLAISKFTVTLQLPHNLAFVAIFSYAKFHMWDSLLTFLKFMNISCAAVLHYHLFWREWKTHNIWSVVGLMHQNSQRWTQIISSTCAVTLTEEWHPFFFPLPVKIQGDSYSFDTAEPEYDIQIDLLPTSVKWEGIKLKNCFSNKKIIYWFLIAIQSIK